MMSDISALNEEIKTHKSIEILKSKYFRYGLCSSRAIPNYAGASFVRQIF